MAATTSGETGHQWAGATPARAALVARPGRVSSVAKATVILGSFTPLITVLSLRQIFKRTGIPRSTAHALCLTLCDAGLLEEVHRRGYRLGPALIGLGGQVIDRMGLVEAAEGVLERLVRRSGTEAHLAQLVDGWVVYLDRATSVHGPPMNNRVGLRAPAHRTGCGKAALSLLEPSDVSARVGAACRAERTVPPDLDRLCEELAHARRRGYVVNTEFQPGRVSVAAPVVDRAALTAGGVSVAGPVASFTAEVVAAAARDVRATAAIIGGRLRSAGR